MGGAVSQFIAYAHAQQTSKHPETFGKGNVEGVLAAGAVNNSREGGNLIPTVAFGIPGSISMAILLSVFLLKGLVPGPAMLTRNLNVTYSMVWVIVLSNIIAVCVSFLFLNQLVRLTHVKATLLVPFLLVLTAFGAYTAHNSFADILLMLAATVVGIAAIRWDWPRAPLLLALVLGDIAERYLFLSYSLYEWTWLTRPLVMAFAVVTVAGLRVAAASRAAAFERRSRPRSRADLPDHGWVPRDRRSSCCSRRGVAVSDGGVSACAPVLFSLALACSSSCRWRATLRGPRCRPVRDGVAARGGPRRSPNFEDELLESSPRRRARSGSRRSAGWRLLRRCCGCSARWSPFRCSRWCYLLAVSRVARAGRRLCPGVLAVRLRLLRAACLRLPLLMTKLSVTVTRQRRSVRGRGRAADAAGAVPSRTARTDRHTRRLRRRRMRRLLGAGGRRTREVVPDARGAGQRTRGDDGRRAGAATARSIRSRRPSSATSRCSAASARRDS